MSALFISIHDSKNKDFKLTTTEVIFWDAKDSAIKTTAFIAIRAYPVPMWNVSTGLVLHMILAVSPDEKPLKKNQPSDEGFLTRV